MENNDQGAIHNQIYGVKVSAYAWATLYVDILNFYKADLTLKFGLFELTPIKNTFSFYRPDRSIIESLNGNGLNLLAKIRGEYNIKLLWYETSIVENMKTAKTSLVGKKIAELTDPALYTLDIDTMTYNNQY